MSQNSIWSVYVNSNLTCRGKNGKKIYLKLFIIPKKLVQVLKFWNLIFALHGKIAMNKKNKVTTKIALHGKIDMKNKK
jgi:hypothetical protein